MSDGSEDLPTDRAHPPADTTGATAPVAVPERVALAGALAAVAALRLLPYPTVFRDGFVVLPSNDPYYYQYVVETATAGATSPLDLGAFLDLPGGVEAGEPLLVAVAAFLAEALGGTPRVVGLVLAWYPVATAVVTGVLVYALARRLSGDVRVGLAAVLLFAVVPGHAFRTSIGFADHHAFDYVWLALTVYALVGALTADADDRERWLFGGLLGVAVAGQTLAWEASPLLLVPLAAGLAIAGFYLVRARRPTALDPVAAGFAVAALAAAAVHGWLGWHRPLVAAVPGLLLLGTLGVLLAVRIAVRFELPAAAVPAAEALAAGGLLAVASTSSALSAGLARLFGTAGIAETTALGDAFGPLVGPTVMLGFAAFLGVPVMCWVWWRSAREEVTGWVVTGVYAWYFLALAFAQRRFTGELAPVLAVFAGAGLVSLLSWLEVVDPVEALSGGRVTSADGGTPADHTGTVPLPGRRRFLAVGSLSAVFAGFPAVYTSVLQSRTAVDDHAHGAARWMRRYAAERGWTYPDSYVFSGWGENRMYNYFVNGQSKSYSYARHHYGDFLLSTDPDGWYDRLRDRVGFVVVERTPSDLHPRSAYVRLFDHYGSRAGRTPGLDHYRAVYAAGRGHTKVFTLVPGATLSGTGRAGESVTISVEVSVPGAEFTYERRATVGADGGYSVTVPYPGTYRVRETGIVVDVPERAVRDGRTVAVGRE